MSESTLMGEKTGDTPLLNGHPNLNGYPIGYGSAGYTYNPERPLDDIPLGGEGAMWMAGENQREIASLQKQIVDQKDTIFSLEAEVAELEHTNTKQLDAIKVAIGQLEVIAALCRSYGI